MTRMLRRGGLTLLAVAALISPRIASAHFIWLTVRPAASPQGTATIQTFLSETPTPEGPQFLKNVKGMQPTVDGQSLPTTTGEGTLNSTWSGKLPAFIDAERDLGVKSRNGKDYRLYYTSRAQTTPVAADTKETGKGLRVRLITKDGKPVVQVLFNGEPAAKARLKIYPTDKDAHESAADEQGLATIEGLAEGKTALWANWVEGQPGEVEGKAFAETRYYATLTVSPQGAPSASAPRAAAESDETPELATTFALMPKPAVNSFGGAVLGDWLYVYSGHIGKVHEYSTETTSKHFRRLSLKDHTTWEDLPLDRQVQGVALVSDGTYLYRVGGMIPRNEPGKDHDLESVTDFARFDPTSKAWTSLSPLPVARSTHDAVVIGRTVYAVGGWTMDGAWQKAKFNENVVAFDLDKPEAGWKTIEQPFRRRALSVAQADGKLYVLGGLNDSLKIDRKVEVYDPASGKWTSGPDLPGNAKNDGFGTSAFNIDGKLYFSGIAGQIFRLDPEGKAWELIGAWSLPRTNHRLLPGPGHTILAIGGGSKGKQTLTIEAIGIPAASAAPAAGGE
ncbi:galactose oxidase [Singulisphaera sp. PoT]|uniref:galactose oxidase n=1 Tax=Singulisphaera sp. PoT TaxID=3411797 RepID=UPI003BF5A7D6